MHIADGIIDARVSIVANVVSLGIIYLSSKKTPMEEIPKMGITGAALFVSSLIHIPFAGTSLHPGLYGIAGIILGKRSFPVIFSVLLFQALIFQHGGLLSVGINSVNMGAGALLSWIVWKQKFMPEYLRAVIAGFIGVFVPALLMGIEFQLSGYGKGILYIFSIYIVAAVVEGLVSLSVVKFFRKVNSNIINQ